jgi:hypothetical protein
MIDQYRYNVLSDCSEVQLQALEALATACPVESAVWAMVR